MIAKALKVVVSLIIVVLVLFLIAANFSGVSSSYECPGSITSNGNSNPLTVYFELDRYRWWVGLWSDSYGNMLLEIPNKGVTYYNHLEEAANQIQIGYSPNELKGMFSTLSKSFSINTYLGFFDGICRDVTNDT